MDFIEYSSNWAKSEVLQGKVMVGIGVLVLIAMALILRSDNEMLKGGIIPLSLMLLVLLGYGGYILKSRPAHSKTSIELYKQSKMEGVKKEIEKHVNDNKSGNTLLKIYPILMLLSIIPLFFNISNYYKGMAVGFAFLFIAAFLIDSGFISRSNAFISFLEKI